MADVTENMGMLNETLTTIQQRRSTRAYLPKQIDEAVLTQIVDAGICAPYAQEFSRIITVVQNGELLSRLNHAAKSYARNIGMEHLRILGMTDGFHCLYHAPTLILVSGAEDSVSPDIDSAAAMQNMLIAAESLDVGACWIYFVLLAFSSPFAPELRDALQLPDGFKPCAAAVMGYKQGVQPATRLPNPRSATYIR